MPPPPFNRYSISTNPPGQYHLSNKFLHHGGKNEKTGSITSYLPADMCFGGYFWLHRLSRRSNHRTCKPKGADHVAGTVGTPYPAIDSGAHSLPHLSDGPQVGGAENELEAVPKLRHARRAERQVLPPMRQLPSGAAGSVDLCGRGRGTLSPGSAWEHTVPRLRLGGGRRLPVVRSSGGPGSVEGSVMFGAAGQAEPAE